MAIVDVVKYDGTPDVFAWKYPNEALSTWTQLIVNESQEAILFKGGAAYDVFESGTYTLDTDNIPLLNKIIKLPFGGRSPFSAEVWFVSKVFSLDIKWGTPSPIQLQDPKYGVFVPVRSFGQFGIRIKDSMKFLVKLVGTMPAFDKENMVDYFRGLFVTRVKDTVSSYLVHKQISILEINAYLDEISEYMKKSLEPVLGKYGIELVNFYVNDINVPEDDSAVKKLKYALAKRAEMDIIGYNYQQERSFDTLEGAATNRSSGSASFMGAGLGLGMGAGLGGQLGNLAGQINTGAQQAECPQCHGRMDRTMRFCPSCGCDTKNAPPKESAEVKCSACGAVFSKTAKFCPECGNKYDPCPKCGADLPQGALKCDACGYEIPSLCPDCGKPLNGGNQKFCAECGAPLSRKCPHCSAEIGIGAKFCPECGQAF